MFKQNSCFVVFFLVMIGMSFVGCTDSELPSANELVVKAPAAFSEGEGLFNNNCAACHGIGAQGTDRGPTFLSKIYEPGHHGDGAFRLAVKKGVRAHHWNFGNMPKIRGLSSEEVSQIIAYVRWIQRENGIS